MEQLLPTGAGVAAPVPGPPPARTRQPTWLLPAGLILLAVVPMFGGSVRLIEIAGDVQVTPDNDHVFITNPVPIVLHIISSCVYAAVGAFQFSAGLRRRHRRWHRASGRMLIPLGVAAALSALWMTLFYPQPAGTGQLLYAVRLLFGSAMAYSLVRGFTAIRARDVREHRAWMMRAYAIGLGAGTQIFTLGFGEAIFGDGELIHDMLMTAAWVINLSIAEWAIRRHRTPSRRSAPAEAVGVR